MASAGEKSRDVLEVDVKKASRGDLQEVVDVLARAFDDDPLANWVVVQDGKRKERLRRYFDVPIRHVAARRGEIYTTGDVLGAAVWMPPGVSGAGFFDELRMLPRMLRCTGVRRLPAILLGLLAVEKKRPRIPYWYLMALGVEPAFQGRSIGTQLMAPVLARCDSEGVPAYLESSKERNIPLYERNGFRVTDEVEVARGGPKVWLMWREPARPSPGPA